MTVLFQQKLGVPYVQMTINCTQAGNTEEIRTPLLDLRHGKEMALPPLTFVSTVNAFVHRNMHTADYGMVVEPAFGLSLV